MNKLLEIPVIILFCFQGFSGKAQGDSAYRFVKMIKADIVDFTIDNFDNIYTINNSNQLKKLNAVFVFDYYGSLKNKIPITGWKDFKVVGKYIFGVNRDTLFRYEINAFRYDEMALPGFLTSSIKLNFSASRIYALKKEGLEIYAIQ